MALHITLKKIKDYDNRWLRLIVNEDVDPAKGLLHSLIGG